MPSRNTSWTKWRTIEISLVEGRFGGVDEKFRLTAKGVRARFEFIHATILLSKSLSFTPKGVSSQFDPSLSGKGSGSPDQGIRINPSYENHIIFAGCYENAALN